MCEKETACRRCWQVAVDAVLAKPCCRWLQTARADNAGVRAKAEDEAEAGAGADVCLSTL